MITPPPPGLCAWIDGALVPWDEARVHASAHHYGVGVFEGLRVYQTARGPAVFRLADHTRRLFRSAKMMGIAIPWSADDLDAAQRTVVRESKLGDAYLRPFVFHDGPFGLGLHTGRLEVRTAILALPWADDGAHLDPEASARGIRVVTSSYSRHAPTSLLSKAKANGNYMTSILALAEARAAGAEDALLLDREGFVTEASGANVFAVFDRELHTPPRESVLEGITRDTVFALAGDLGLAVRERRITRDELYVADEVFLTGTAAEITRVRAVDGRTFEPGPVTGRLRALYADEVRGKGTRGHWLAWVGERDEGSERRRAASALAEREES